MAHQVAVVGGGFAGLFTASELLAAGIDDMVVLDRAASPGGVTRTIRRDGYSLEPAAGTLLLPHPHLSPVLDHLGAHVEPAIDAGLRYIYTGGRLVTLPSSPKAMCAPLVPWSAKLRAAREPFVATPPASNDETLDEFLRRRLGPGLGGTLASVAASGVFAGDPSRLSARAAFPAFPALEDQAGSIVRGALQRLRSRPKGAVRPTSHIPVAGMSGMADTAVGRLGSRYRSGFVVEAVERSGDTWRIRGSEEIEAKHVVLAVGPSDAGPLVGGELEDVLSRAVTAPAVVVGLGGDADRFPLPPGFGALVGPDANTATLGVLFESSYAPNRAPVGHSLVKMIAGGAKRPEVIDWDDERLVEEIGGEVARILDRDIEATFVQIVRHRRGIPQYEVGHRAWLAEVEALVEPDLHLTGWGYRGVGISHLAGDAVAVARRIAESSGSLP